MNDNKPSKKKTKPVRYRDRQNTEHAFIEAAIEIFSSKGFEKATTREIAISAGYSEALIQRYFESKEGLLLAVFKNSNVFKDRPGFDDLTTTDSVFDDLRRLLSIAVAYFHVHSAITRIVVSRAIIDPSFRQLLNKTMNRTEVRGLWEQRLRVHMGAGRIAQNADLQGAAELLSTMAFHLGFIMQEVMALPGSEIDRLITTYTRFVVDGIAAKTRK